MSTFLHRHRAAGLWVPKQLPPPGAAVEVDPNHPLAVGLQILVVPATGFRDLGPRSLLFSQQAPTGSGVGLVATPEGAGFSAGTAANSSGLVSVNSPFVVTNGAATLWIRRIVSGQAVSGTPYPLVGFRTASNDGVISTLASSYTLAQYGSNSGITATAAFSASTAPQSALATFDGALNGALYANGVSKQTGTTGAFTITTADQFYVGTVTNEVTLAAAYWNRMLSAAEIQLLEQDPYGMLRPRAPMFRGVNFEGGTGTATGSGVASAVGSDLIAGTGSTTGAGTASATGAELAAAVGPVVGSGTASAAGLGLAGGTGTATGSGVAAGTISVITNDVGTATGSGIAAAVGTEIAASVGTATGAGVASATNQNVASAVGTATGSGIASGTGLDLGIGVGTATGSGVAAGTSSVITNDVGTATGSGVASGVASGFSVGTGAAAGTGTVAATGKGLAAAVGTVTVLGDPEALGAAAANGVGTVTVLGDPEAISANLSTGTGTVTVLGDPEAVGASWALSTGTVTVLGDPEARGLAIFAGIGAAFGVGLAEGYTKALASGVGTAIGAVTASGTPPSPKAATGTATGSGVAFASAYGPLTAVVVGDTVTFTGTPIAGYALGLAVGPGISPTGYTYTILPTDTLATIAAKFAAVIPGATSSGNSVTCPLDVAALIYQQQLAVLVTKNQSQQFRIIVWAQNYAARDVAAGNIDAAMAQIRSFTMPDGTVTMPPVQTVGRTDDGGEKDNLYRRDLVYNIDYSTTVTQYQPVMLFGEYNIWRLSNVVNVGTQRPSSIP